MPRFVVCIPTDGLSSSVAPCGDADGVFYSPVMMEFPAPGSVSFANGETLFAYGFMAVMTLWLVGLGVGAILSVLRSRWG